MPRPVSSGQLADLSLEDLMNIEVTSVSKQPEKISAAPAAISVITQYDIQRSGLNSIPELLRLSPGMDVARVNANTWAVSARGFNGPLADNLLVLMDGRSVYTPTFGGVLWNSIDYPLGDIDRIEVIRGPGATLWGANAVNGVVNILSKPADQTQGLSLNSRVGTDESDADVRYGGQIDDRTFFRVYAKYGYDASFPLAGDELNHDQWQTMQTGFRIDRYSTPIDTLTLQGDFGQQNAKERFQGLLGGEPLGNDDTTTGNIVTRWTHSPSAREQTSLQFYYTGQSLNTYPAGYHESDLDLQFQNRFPLSTRQDVTWGFGARGSIVALTAPSPYYYDPQRLNEYIFNAFVQDQVALIPDRLTWTIGTKVEYDTLTDLELEPGTRLAWTPNKRNTVWAAISRPVRSPALINLSQAAFGPLTLIPDHVHPERTLAYELGYKTRPFDSVTVDVSGFYNTSHGLIGAAAGAQSPVVEYWSNSVDAQTYGAELAVDWQVNPRWKLAGSYTFLNSMGANNGDNPGGTQPRSVAADLTRTSPENQFQLHSYYDITKNLQFNTSGYFVQALPNVVTPPFREQHVSDYFRLDLGMTWRVDEHMSVSAGVQNVLQSQHRESGNISTYVVPGEVPRSAYVQLHLEF